MINASTQPTAEFGRLTRWFGVGVAGLLLDCALLVALKELGGLDTAPANLLAFVGKLLNNFLLHRSLTFADKAGQPALGQLARYGAVSLAGVLLNTALLLLLELAFGALLGSPADGYLPAKVMATILVFACKYPLNRRWTFR
ncbi:MAG TPA: GtrA family protein [Roseiflexaceae bacterium]|nr:GtrA family protein [Roseiflexaceae bacterium]